MQALSETIEAENPDYFPPQGLVYDRPQDFDLTDIIAFRDGQPHDYFHKLRSQAPVAWCEISRASNISGFWSLSRYEDVRACDLDAKRFSSQAGGILMGYNGADKGPKRLREAALNSMISLDQPFHIPLRMEHRSFFTPDYIAGLQKSVEGEVHRLLDNVEAKAKKNGSVNFVDEFSQHLPLFTLCEMLGIDEADRKHIVRWMHYLENAAYIVGNPDSKITMVFVAKFMWNIRQMFAYGQRILANRRKHPRNDLLSAIANAKLDGSPLSQSYLDGSWLLIIFAGNDTTRNSLSGTMRLLTQFPEQKQMLLEQPNLMAKLVPEALRLVSPVMYMRRTALAEAEFSGQKIMPGEKVLMWYGAANRDPDVFENPDAMDIHRHNADKHLAFGTGAHVCLGQRIAIMQLETAYKCTLDRFPTMRWTGKDAHAPNNFVCAISEVEVALN